MFLAVPLSCQYLPRYSCLISELNTMSPPKIVGKDRVSFLSQIFIQKENKQERPAEASCIHKFELNWMLNNHTKFLLGKYHGGLAIYVSDNSRDSFPKTLIARCVLK